MTELKHRKEAYWKWKTRYAVEVEYKNRQGWRYQHQCLTGIEVREACEVEKVLLQVHWQQKEDQGKYGLLLN